MGKTQLELNMSCKATSVADAVLLAEPVLNAWLDFTQGYLGYFKGCVPQEACTDPHGFDQDKAGMFTVLLEQAFDFVDLYNTKRVRVSMMESAEKEGLLAPRAAYLRYYALLSSYASMWLDAEELYEKEGRASENLLRFVASTLVAREMCHAMERGQFMFLEWEREGDCTSTGEHAESGQARKAGARTHKFFYDFFDNSLEPIVDELKTLLPDEYLYPEFGLDLPLEPLHAEGK